MVRRSSRGDVVFLNSHSDLIVSGSEQPLHGGATFDIYRFSGVDGSLTWNYSTWVTVATKATLRLFGPPRRSSVTVVRVAPTRSRWLMR